MSDESVIVTKFQILDLFSNLSEEVLNTIEQWISSQSYKQDLKMKKNLITEEKILIDIGESIKSMIPLEAEMPSENIVPPVLGDQSDCNAINTCHIDEFLYDEKELEQLCNKDIFKRHYCMDCNSRNVKELHLISHSMSRKALQYVFKVLLPRDLMDKQLLDVGSRIGAIIVGAYYLSNISRIIGVEMNKECCDVQEKVIDQFSMDRNRVRVVHADVTQKGDIVQTSDIIVINVLDFFVDIEKHKEMWYFFKKHIKKGTYLVCNRCIVSTLDCLGIFEEFMDWAIVCKPYQLENEIFFDVDECSELYLYTIN